MLKKTGLTVVLLGIILSAASPPAAGKSHSVMQVKPGLWEFSSAGKVTGDTVFPDELLARIPANQRAGQLAELRQMLARSSRQRECVNQAAFERPLFTVGSGCNETIVTNAANRLAIVTECRSTRGKLAQRSTSKVVASPTTSTTLTHAVSTQGGKTMVVDTVQSGHWVSAACGNVRGIQEMP